MKEMRIGNVIESPGGGKWIVTEIDDEMVHAVSFEHENTSAVQPLEDTEYEEPCRVCGESASSLGCERCGETGVVTKPKTGWKHAKVLAPTVKAFIERGMRRMFKI